MSPYKYIAAHLTKLEAQNTHCITQPKTRLHCHLKNNLSHLVNEKIKFQKLYGRLEIIYMFPDSEASVAKCLKELFGVLSLRPHIVITLHELPINCKYMSPPPSPSKKLIRLMLK